MLAENTKLFFTLYVRPRAALSEIIDRGRWLFGAVLVTAVAVLLQFGVTSRIYYGYEAVPTPAQRLRLPGGQFRSHPVSFERAERQTVPEAGEEPGDEDDGEALPVLVPRRRPLPFIGQRGWWVLSFSPLGYLLMAFTLALLYVPATVLALTSFDRLGSFSVILRRDYGALLSTTLMAWAASHLPFALLGLLLWPVNLGPDVALGLWLLGNLYFGGLMVCALQTVCGTSLGRAAAAVGVSWVVMSFDSWLYRLATFSPYLTLIWLAPLLLGGYAALGAAYRQRQRFRHGLESATVNPRDAEAHYQLGLLHQQRRQFKEAVERFKKAIEIDPRETDAHFQLGRIAREQERYQDAIDHFSTVVAQDEKHAQSEIWREIGATYLAASMYEDARGALERYLERRPYDAEGLFHLGESLSHLGQPGRARQCFEQCIEASHTAPYYLRHQAAKWAKLARAKL